ncbi:MAG: hypothetical protein VR65_27110 [Desulfobulbaceae bacterium BRH_c16a]|nr:MAG: hypothetical protein VR65_27110 [Desulfobulbaceae bacterium BRH_c16a]
MHDRIGIGIIGTGKHGSRYANHIVEDFATRFRLTAISRRSPEAQDQAERWHATLYSDWRDLISSHEVDAVICAVTPNLNPDIARFCAEHGKPLLIEKPLATDVSSAGQIVDFFNRASVPLTVAQTLRYNSVVRGLKKHLPAMGRLFSLSATHRLEPSTMSWLEQPEIAGGGVIFHTAVHLFDTLRFITGAEVVKIRGAARQIYNQGLEDMLVAEVVLSNGSLGIIDTSKVGPARAGRYEFVCEHGQLQGDQIHGILQKIEGACIMPLSVTPPAPTILPLLEEWYGFLKGKGNNPIPGEEGLAAVKICHACRQSIKSGEWVDVEDL